MGDTFEEKDRCGVGKIPMACYGRDEYCDSVGMTAVVMEGAEDSSWGGEGSRSVGSHSWARRLVRGTVIG